MIMSGLSGRITGGIFILIGLILIILSFIYPLFLLIYGIPLLIIGLFIFFNKDEDKIEEIKKIR